MTWHNAMLRGSDVAAAMGISERHVGQRHSAAVANSTTEAIQPEQSECPQGRHRGVDGNIASAAYGSRHTPHASADDSAILDFGFCLRTRVQPDRSVGYACVKLLRHARQRHEERWR